MFDLVIRGVRTVTSSAYDQFLSTIYDGLVENLRLIEAHNTVTILDVEGQVSNVTRLRRYAVRWAPVDYLPDERITVGPTGSIVSFRVVGEPPLQHQVLEGGVGHDHVVFRIRAPEMAPDYLLLRTRSVDVVVHYEAEGVYTEDESPFLSFVYRFPRGKGLPRRVHLRLELPSGRPLLSPPRTFRIRDLAAAERALTDLGLDESLAWVRTHSPSPDSCVETSRDDTLVEWSIQPSRANTAHKLEWDWWPQHSRPT